jgi:LacI family transcriptional regulator
MAATIKDIARKTGLGLATISKYINGGNVREKNRAAIEQAIKELDFKINEIARSLKTSRSKTIGVVIPELSNGFITSIVSVMEDILMREGYGVLVCDCRTQVRREREAMEFLLGKMADAVVLMSAAPDGRHLETVLERGIPVVLLDRLLPDVEGKVDAVLVDNFKAAFDSTNYLLKRGHREIGIIVGPRDVYTSRQRLSGYSEALIGSGIPPDQKLMAFTDYTVSSGYEAMKALYADNPGIGALFVTNYETTVGAILAVNELGIRIPDQLSMIGFDNLELAGLVKPALTVVEQPLADIGRAAAQTLLHRLGPDGDKEPPRRIILETSLREGDSVLRIVHSS